MSTVHFQILWNLVISSIFILFIFSTLISYYSKEESFKYYSIYSFFLLLYLFLKIPYDLSFIKLIYNSQFAVLKWYIQVIYHFAYYFFFLSFLDIEQHFKHFFKQIKRAVKLIFWFSTFLFTYSIIANNSLLFNNYFLFFYTPIIFVLAVFTIYKSLLLKNSLKYYFIVGSGIYVVFSIIALIFSYNIAEGDWMPPLFYFYIGIFIEHLIFAFGLAYKVKSINSKMLFQYSENEKIKANQEKLLQSELKKKENDVRALTESAEQDRIDKLKTKFEDEAYQLHLTSLQNQMNPHFIFNALNSIKFFLIENNKEQAIFYLNKFSKLIRKILESSRIKEVSLQEELDTIKLYLEIESMRFEGEVLVDISVMESVDLKKIKLPPLILQPFVENAIWHGLMLSKEEKKISIRVYKVEESVCLSLKDNGIGIEQAKLNTQRKKIKKESLGLKMTKERINYYNRKQGCNYSYRIKDLHDELEHPCGTEVIFTFD